jgi:hypothetical protein
MYACLYANCTNPGVMHVVKTRVDDVQAVNKGSYQGWSFCSPEHARDALRDCDTFRQFEHTYA